MSASPAARHRARGRRSSSAFAKRRCSRRSLSSARYRPEFSTMRMGESEAVMRRASSRCAVGACLLPPQTTPRAFEATMAALTRSEISLASYSAMAARMWIVSRLACGKSASTNSTPLSMSCAIKATLRARRSRFAMTRTALYMRQSLKASLNCGRAAFVPLSTSVNSANRSPETD